MEVPGQSHLCAGLERLPPAPLCVGSAVGTCSHWHDAGPGGTTIAGQLSACAWPFSCRTDATCRHFPLLGLFHFSLCLLMGRGYIWHFNISTEPGVLILLGGGGLFCCCYEIGTILLRYLYSGLSVSACVLSMPSPAVGVLCVC